MKCRLQKVLLFALLFCASLRAFSQVDIKVYDQSSYVSKDTVLLTIDPNDNSGTGATNKLIFFNIYNLSPNQAESIYLEAEWLCSNSSVYYQFCQKFPPDYLSGNCNMFHKDGLRTYDDGNIIPADTCSYNYLQCHFFIYDYSVEAEYEKICKFSIRRTNTHEVLDVMYLIIRRGNRPCSTPTGIPATQSEDFANIYPNPARDVISIVAKDRQIAGYTLYTPEGRMVLNQATAPEKRIDINVGALANGIYYLKLTDRENRAFYKKIVVDH